MKLTWHIVLKDLRRLRWALVLLGVLVVAQYVAWVWVRAAGSASEVQRGAVLALWGMQVLSVWLLVPQFVHEDPLSGSAEWRVRPISGARLLGAKGLGIFLALCVWPSVLTLPWWLELGFGAGEIGRVMAVNTLGMAALTGVALAVAVLTESFAKFIAWSLVLVAAAGMVALVMAAGLPANAAGPVPGALVLTRVALAWGIVLATAATVVPLQFLGRRPVLARGIAAGAAVLTGVVVQAWPWTEAQMLARTGLARYALPQVSARMGPAALWMPATTGRAEATVRVTTEFVTRGLAAGDRLAWDEATAAWTIGDYRGPALPVEARRSTWWVAWWDAPLAKWAQGDETRREEVGTMVWHRKFPAKVAPVLRNGEGLVRAKNLGTLWRGERGPVVPVRAGAGSALGLRLVHVVAVDAGGERERRRLSWLEIEPLFVAVKMLELLNGDGVARHRWPAAVLANGDQELADYGRGGYRPDGLGVLGAGGRMPVGVMTVTAVESDFGNWWRSSRRQGEKTVPFEGATLASVMVVAAAAVEAELAETQFLPEPVVEGSLAETLRRARAEDRLALVRLMRRTGEAEVYQTLNPLERWRSADVRGELSKRYVTGQATEEEAARLRKSSDAGEAATLVVFNARGDEVDRWRDLTGEELAAALRANAAGKTYAAALTEALAAQGGTDRALRYQLHEALRARGELAGAFGAVLWLIENPRDEFIARDLNAVGDRLERLVAVDGAVKAQLNERRERAAETLRRDPGDTGAARMLMVITLGLRGDSAVWREFPRLLPRENPLWWEFTGSWFNRTVSNKSYREAIEGVDAEKFFAAGPAWVRAQLARRALNSMGQAGRFEDWQRQLLWAGRSTVEALAGTGQEAAALRVAHAVRGFDRTTEARYELRTALARGGGEKLGLRWLGETRDGR